MLPGQNCIITLSAKIADSVSIGHNVTIENDVIVGPDTTIGHNVLIKSGARIGHHCFIGPYCYITGPCSIGNHVSLRAFDVISRGLEIQDHVFIGSNVTTTSIIHINYGRGNTRQFKTRIGFGCVIGSRSTLIAGLNIPPNTIIGQGSNVVKPIDHPAIYAGNPARKIKDLPPDQILEGESLPLMAWDDSQYPTPEEW